MDLKDKYVLILGTKRSGFAAAELLRRYGARVRAMDSETPSPEEQAKFAAIGVPVVLQDPDNVADSSGGSARAPDMIVLSPGVPYDLPMLVSARAQNIPVIGEVELASYFLQGPVIGITGSNGKTTTTALTGHILKHCGIACQVGGNIGRPAASLVDSSADGQWNVLELSSFQLESIERFHARISCCLNVTPDHLDRHHTFEAYVDAKARLFETQAEGDSCVLNHDDGACRGYAGRTKAQVHWFSLSQKVSEGVWVSGDQLYFNGRPFMKRGQVMLRGQHNLENAMAAALMAHLAGAPLDAIGDAVAHFPGVEHRIEFVRNIGGVDYYNDSKATNVDAALKAIEAFPRDLWIILGGKDKASDYSPLRPALAQRAKAVLLIGAQPPYPYAAAPLIKKAIEGAAPLHECGTLDKAVEYARGHAAPGDVVLLAPACASFDQFRNFEHRGDVFKHLVQELL